VDQLINCNSQLIMSCFGWRLVPLGSSERTRRRRWVKYAIFSFLMASILVLIVVGCSVADIVREDGKDIDKKHHHHHHPDQESLDDDPEDEKRKTKQLTGAIYGLIGALILIQLIFMWFILKEISWTAFFMTVLYTLCLIAILIPWSNEWDHWMGDLFNVFSDVFQMNIGIVALWVVIDSSLAILCYYLFILSWTRDDYIILL